MAVHSSDSSASPEKSQKSIKSPAARVGHASTSPAASPAEPDQMEHQSSDADPKAKAENFIEELAYKYCNNDEILQSNLEPFPKLSLYAGCGQRNTHALVEPAI